MIFKLLIMLMFLFVSYSCFAQVEIEIKNGGTVTGYIISENDSLIKFKSLDNIIWDIPKEQVKKINKPIVYNIKTINGESYTGTITTPPDSNYNIIQSNVMTVIVPLKVVLSLGLTQDSLNPKQIDFQTLVDKYLIYYQPWRNSVYIASTLGYPKGLRFDLGYNFGDILSLGLSFGISDFWSSDPEEGTIGFIGKLNIPLKNSRLTPYLLFGEGGTFAIMGGSDKFTILSFGFIYPIKDWLQLRQEICLVFTSKHISGGGIFGTSTLKKESKTLYGFNITFEIDFARFSQ